MSATINNETAALSLEVLLQINVSAADPERLHKMTLLDSAIRDLEAALALNPAGMKGLPETDAKTDPDPSLPDKNEQRTVLGGHVVQPRTEGRTVLQEATADPHIAGPAYV
jgi:hypothetical protein